MCRIFCSPDKEQPFKKYDLWCYFEELEKSMGRDGNGIYNFTKKRLWKNHDRMPREANINGGILFHTRYATNGLVKDYNCQPFDNKKYVFTHNGVFTAVTAYARLLGFQYSDKKYSDSYMMAWIMEKVGIFNFYNAFKDKYYGVIVVYDKKTDKIYLLKTGGSFTYGQFENGTYVYASSKLDFWKLKEEPKDFDKGLFIISGDGFTQLDKIEYTSRYVTYYGSNYSNIYPTRGEYTNTKRKEKVKKQLKERRKLNKEFCAYCHEDLDKEHIYYHCTNKICEACSIHYELDDDLDEEEPVGIGALFADSMPKKCNGCNWIYNEKCWFGGIGRDNPINIINPNTKKLVCNTKKSKLDVVINCDTCNKKLHKDDKWGIVKETIMCRECKIEMKSAESYQTSCDKCLHYIKPSGDEPCSSCWSDEGVPRNWTPVIIRSCEGCYYYNCANTDYPCKYCRETKEGMSEWTQKNGNRDLNSKCAICGWHFDTWDTPVENNKGELICEMCDKYGYDEEMAEYRNDYGHEEDYEGWEIYNGYKRR